MCGDGAESAAHETPTDEPQAGWRLGDEVHLDLVSHLRSAARTAANEALTSFRLSSPAASLWAATAAGIATESALKLCLASTNPAFIASNTESAIRLSRGTTTVGQVRTHGGQDAAKAVRLLHPQHPMALGPKTIDVVLNVRNSAAHMSVVEPEQLSLAMQGMTAVVEACLTLTSDLEPFWDPQHDALRQELISQKVQRSRLALTRKLAAAGSRLRDRLDGIPEQQHVGIMAILEAPAVAAAEPPEVVTHICPVCEHRGSLFCYVTESDTDFVGSAYPDDHPDGLRYAYPEAFECGVCGLQLNDNEIEQAPEFWDVLETEVEPSREFVRALADWKHNAWRDKELEDYFRADLI